MLERLFKSGAAIDIQRRVDGWLNTVTGLGTSRDKRTFWDFQRLGSHGPEFYEGLFLEDDLAAAAVSRLPDRAMRKGFTLARDVQDGEDASQIEEKKKEVKRRLRELKATDKIFQSAVWGRLTGAGILLLGVRGGGPIDRPLDLESEKLRLDFLTVLDLRDMHVSAYYDDPEEPKYGEPRLYGFSPSVAGTSGSKAARMSLIHESRLVIFEGAMVTARERERNNGFAHSILYRSYPKIKAHNAMWSNVEHLLEDMSQAVLSIKGLIDALDEVDSQTMETRIQLMDMARSVARILLIDESETFDRKTTPITGVDSIIAEHNARVAGAFDMPVTELFGTSAKGLNATGEGDQASWYDAVEAYQTNELQDPIETVVRLVVRSLFPEEDPSLWGIKWPSLWSLSPSEEATRRKTVAETDKIYIDGGVVLPEEVTISRFTGPDGYSPETTVDAELRRKLLEIESERLEKEATEPPKPPPMFPPPGQPGAPQNPSQGQQPPEPSNPEDPQPQPQADPETGDVEE